MSVKVFGFGHRSRMGKDTAANFLAGHLRATTRRKLIVKTGFSSKLKAICHDLYTWAGLQDEDFYEKEENAHFRNEILPAIGKTPVEIWIEFGTNVGRAVHSETWIEYPFNRQYDYLIFKDVRFPNEVNRIWKAGGKVFLVENERTPFRVSVADEALASFNRWDGVLKNNGDLKELNELVIKVCGAYL